MKAKLLRNVSGVGSPTFKKGTIVDIEFIPGQRHAMVKCTGFLRLLLDDYNAILEDKELNDFLKEISDDK